MPNRVGENIGNYEVYTYTTEKRDDVICASCGNMVEEGTTAYEVTDDGMYVINIGSCCASSAKAAVKIVERW